MNLAEIGFSASLRGWLWTSNLLTENNVVLNTTYTYNVGNLVTNKTTTNSAGTALQTDNYSYLCDGNVFAENDKSYTYDLRNRLSGVAQTDEDNKNYTFDCFGNRLTKTIGSDTISYTYDNNNRILSQSDDLGVTNYSYDDRGNLYLKTVSVTANADNSDLTAEAISISDTDSQLFQFDGFNRMSGFETGSTTAEYEYDSSGLRTSKTVSGERTEFVLDGIYVIAEINSDGDVTNYIRGLTGIIYREIPDNVKTYYVTNKHGDVTKLVNSSGQIIESYTYDEFGNELNIDSTDDNPFRYCGEYYDTESGLIYLRARYYDPTIGRFISEDPAMDDLNWYVYCASNPINFWDSFGLAKVYYYVSSQFAQEAFADKDLIMARYNVDIYSDDLEIVIVETPETMYSKWEEMEDNVEAVIINMHGSQNSLYLTDENRDSIDLYKLSGKNIGDVLLLACYAGTQADGFNNVATTFLDNNNIKNGVIASTKPIYSSLESSPHNYDTRYTTSGYGFYVYTEQKNQDSNYVRIRLRTERRQTNRYTNINYIFIAADKARKNYTNHI